MIYDDLRDSLSCLAMPDRPALAAIVERGRLHRRRYRTGMASLGATSVVAAGALAVVLIGVHRTEPRSTSPKPRVASHRGTIRTAAFTLVSDRSGKVKLTLTHAQVFDSPELRHALAQDGVPAVVRSDTYCYSDPAAPDPNSTGVLSVRPFDGRLSGPRGLAPAKQLLKDYASGPPLRPNLQELINHTTTVINPAKLPSGTELFFEYAAGRHLLFVSLLYTSSHTCRSGQPPAQ